MDSFQQQDRNGERKAGEESGWCEVCSSWQHGMKRCQQRKGSTALCAIKDKEGVKCSAMHHPSLVRLEYCLAAGRQNKEHKVDTESSRTRAKMCTKCSACGSHHTLA